MTLTHFQQNSTGPKQLAIELGIWPVKKAKITRALVMAPFGLYALFFVVSSLFPMFC